MEAQAVKQKKRIKATKLPVKKRTIGQCIAAIAAGFIPVASYVLVHKEAPHSFVMWTLVLAALGFSAPTLAQWASKWAKSTVKAWGFTVLLEGVMILSTTEILSLVGAAILVAINCHSAWQAAGKTVRN